MDIAPPSKKICFFGIYDPSYARSRVLKAGFERNGYEVVSCRVDLKVHRHFAKYLYLYLEFRKIRNQKFDHILVCYPGQSVVFLARILFGRRIIFDAFVSLYDSSVNDRKVYSPRGPRALYSWFLDWSSCRLASRILLDTNAHIAYFSETFGISPEKCIRVFVGTDETLFFPRPTLFEGGDFTVHFHGTFIPLQGLKYIVEAAHILRNEHILFRIVGSGQESSMIKKQVQDLKLEGIVRLIGKVPLEKVSEYIASAHVSLGIFGDTGKTTRVIPNKVYESIAMGKAVITADTVASRELFESGKTALLVPPADANALAEAIRALKADPLLREKIARNGYELYHAKLLPEYIVKNLLAALGE